MSRPKVYKQYERFQEGSEDIKDDKRIGHPTISTTKENIEKTEEVCILYGSCEAIVTNIFGMKQVAAKTVKFSAKVAMQKCH